MKPSRRRQYGTGSVFWNAGLGLWIGTIEAGTAAKGNSARQITGYQYR